MDFSIKNIRAASSMAWSMLAGGDKKHELTSSGEVLSNAADLPAIPGNVIEFAEALAAGLGFSERSSYTTVEREVATYYAPIVRCATILGGFISRLVCNGRLRAETLEGDALETPRAKAALRMLASTAGYGEPTSNLIKDVVLDYCFEGNGILVPQKLAGGDVVGMKRYLRAGAWSEINSDGELVYNISPAYDPKKREQHPAIDVCLMRWARIRGYSEMTMREQYGFAASPLSMLAPALRIGLNGDKYLLEVYRKGLLSKHFFSYKHSNEDGEDEPDEEQLSQIKTDIAAQAKTGLPIVARNMEATMLDNSPQEKSAAQLRNDVTDQVAMYYGIPSILMNTNQNNWGTGVESFMRIFFQTSLMDHVRALLDPLALCLLGGANRFVVDPNELLIADPEKMAQLIDATHGSSTRLPITTIEEWRLRMNMPKKPMGKYPEHPTPRHVPSMGDDRDRDDRPDG